MGREGLLGVGGPLSTLPRELPVEEVRKGSGLAPRPHTSSAVCRKRGLVLVPCGSNSDPTVRSNFVPGWSICCFKKNE